MRYKKKGRTWWMFRDEFYLDDEGYTADEVKRLIYPEETGALLDSLEETSAAYELRRLTSSPRMQEAVAKRRLLYIVWQEQMDELKQRGDGLLRQYDGPLRQELTSLVQQIDRLLQQHDGLVRQMDELDQQYDSLLRRQDALMALERWFRGPPEATGMPTEGEVEDQMIKLGFTTEDIQQFRATPGVETELQIGGTSYELRVVGKLYNWLSTRMEPLPAQMEGVGAEIEAVGAEVVEIWEQWGSVEVENVMAQVEAELGLARTLPGDREPIPDWLRRAVLARDDYICRYCGRRAQTLDVDHIVPVKQGGRSTFDNLVTACAKCNRSKGGRTPEEAGMTLLPPGTSRR